MPNPLWFHAFSREAITDYFDVLCTSARPAPHMTTTKQCELDLGVASTSVYCYLGRTLEEFGDFAVALRPTPLPDAMMTPFDSGGLIANIRPICSWSNVEKSAYLTACSWSTVELRNLLQQYPGITPEEFRRYLDGERPLHPGPHALWGTVPEAMIWSEISNTWRAWAWEGRWANELPIHAALVAWSCAPARYASILAYADAVSDPALQPLVDRTLSLYVPGGVAHLLDRLKQEQLR